MSETSKPMCWRVAAGWDDITMNSSRSPDEPGSERLIQRISPGIGPRANSRIPRASLKIAIVAASLSAATMAIFKEALGMREFARGPMPGDIRWINLSLPGSSGDLLEFMVMSSQPAATRQHIGFEVSDIQRTYRQLTERG